MASEAELSRVLSEILGRGGLSYRRMEEGDAWATAPLVIGMYEYQVERLSPRLLLALRDYWQSPKMADQTRFGATRATGTPPPKQMRVIPIEESITPDLQVGSYEDIAHLVVIAGARIALGPCVCRKQQAMLGHECVRTARADSCMAFNDFADHFVKQGIGGSIARIEALDALAARQREGLVLMPSNSKEAQFVCSCGPDCCGVLAGLGRAEWPADHALSNYLAVVESDACSACGSCVRMCPMDAVELDAASASVNAARCIGCGVCVAQCGSGAVTLARKPEAAEPPETWDDLMRLYDHTR